MAIKITITRIKSKTLSIINSQFLTIKLRFYHIKIKVVFYVNRSIITQRISMNNKITFIILSSLISLSIYAKNEITSNTSSYTTIEQKDCRTLDSDGVGSIQACEPFEDITVKVIEGDLRQSIILTREGKEYNLNFWSIISPMFSYLGNKIEWRHELEKPKNLKGMIVRFEASDNFDNLDKHSSYLVVSKITKDNMCVVAKVAPSEEQNKVARKILDSNKSLPCLKEFDANQTK